MEREGKAIYVLLIDGCNINHRSDHRKFIEKKDDKAIVSENRRH